jgi:dTDP-4-dehydrorhamnose reductase
MKLLVLGASGMAGHVMCVRLSEMGYDVTGFSRRSLPFCHTLIGDIISSDVKSIVKDYDIVINCIGILNKNVDKNLSAGIWINSYLPHLLSEHAKRVIHLSTDCVFSGLDGGGYAENDFRSADTLYGRSKALGELENGKDLTLRTSIVGPDINENGIGLFNWFMKQKTNVNGYNKAFWSGVTTILLADAVNAAIKQNLSGLYHLTNGIRISKCDMLSLFNTLREKPVEILPVDTVKEDKSLICTRRDFSFNVPSYADMIEDMGEWIVKHKNMYPLYDIKI